MACEELPEARLPAKKERVQAMKEEQLGNDATQAMKEEQHVNDATQAMKEEQHVNDAAQAMKEEQHVNDAADTQPDTEVDPDSSPSDPDAQEEQHVNDAAKKAEQLVNDAADNFIGPRLPPPGSDAYCQWRLELARAIKTRVVMTWICDHGGTVRSGDRRALPKFPDGRSCGHCLQARAFQVRRKAFNLECDRRFAPIGKST